MKKIFANLLLVYLRIISNLQLKKINPVVIGIGGSSGKSSLASLTGLILSKKFKIKESKGKNSETGVPLNILDINIDNYDLISWVKIALKAPFRLITHWEKFDFYIVEMGIDSPNPPKNMHYLLKIIKPSISVLTNIEIEHSMYFDALITSKDEKIRRVELVEKIADQEKLLLTSMDSSGRVVLNLDDEKIRNTSSIKAKSLTVSRKNTKADFYISNVKIEQNLFQIDFKFLDENYVFTLDQVLPKYFSYTIIFSIALAFSAGVGIRESINILQIGFKLPPGRFSVFEGIKKSLLIDSSYNSSLEPAVGALEVVNEIADGRRRIGILGDMRELGSVSKIQHEALAQEMIKNLDYAVIVGDEMEKYVKPVLEAKKFEFVSFRNYKQSKEYIKNMVRNNDIILVKASQNTLFLERAIEILLAHKSEVDKLPRRGKYWNNVRNKTP